MRSPSLLRRLSGALWHGALALAIVTLGFAPPAVAQSFPDTSSWVPLPCADGPMTDLHRDQSGALKERDIVGDVEAPAGYSAADDQYLYLRLRLDEDPAPGQSPRPFAWGLEIDIDDDLSTYEILIIVNGNAEAVEVYENSETTLANDPNDPADEPPVATHPFDTNARSIAAADGSSFGGNADFFIDLAIPWSDLAPLGLDPATPLVVWAASSSNSNSLNGDFACHDGSGDAPTLSELAPPRTVLDPLIDSDDDGYSDREEIVAGTDPGDPNSVPSGPVTGDGGVLPPPNAGSVVMEGGGGCRCEAGSTSPADGLLPLLLLLPLFVRRSL